MWHRVKHHRPCCNARAVPDLDIAEDLGARPDHHAAANFRMAIFVFLASAAERHAMEDRDVVVDDRGFADYQPGRVIEEDAASDARIRIDVGPKHRR